MTESEKKACHGIIHANAVAASGIAAGLAQFPGGDNAPLAAIELEMTMALGGVFGISVTKAGAASILSGVVGTTVGRVVSQVLVGWIPGVGNAINAGTAASVVEGIGWSVAKTFEAQRDADREKKNNKLLED